MNQGGLRQLRTWRVILPQPSLGPALEMADVMLVIQVFVLKCVFLVEGCTPASLREASTLPCLTEVLAVLSSNGPSALLLAFTSQEGHASSGQVAG